MKIFKNKFFFILIIFLVLISTTTANAETSSKTMEATITNNGSHIFAIKWEQNDAELELITPDGTVITKKNVDEYGTYKKNKEELKIQYIISNAKAGNWKMKIIKDKSTNLGKVKVGVTELKGVLTVKEFEVKQNEDETITFNWKVSNSAEGDIQVSIGYDYDSYGYNGEELLSGYYKTEKTAKITSKDISPDNYYFYIKVEDSEGIVAYKYSEIIEIKNSKAPRRVEVYELTTKDKAATIKWKPLEEDIEGYKIYYYIEGEQGYKLLEENTVDKEITEYTSELPFEDSRYKIGITAYNSEGLESQMSERELNFKKTQDLKLNVKWIEENVTNDKNIVIPIEIDRDSKATAYHNGKAIIEDIKENGGVRFNLDEGMNNILFEVEGRDGNKRTEERGYYLDTTPPQLGLDKDYANEHIKASYITISGRVELGAVLTINNNRVDYDKTDGSFSYNLKLTRSNKKLNILAEDEAGNISQYECDIDYSPMSLYKQYIYYIILGILAFGILVIYYIKKRKDRENEA